MFNEIKNKVENLKKKFSHYANDCKGILLFGSYAKKNPTERSDTDICLILPSKNMLRKLYEKFGGKYEFIIFENLPLYIKIDVINHHIVLLGEELELSEYFYYSRKLWKDMKRRIEENQFETFDERMRYRRKWLNEKEKILGRTGNV